ncbi:MAG: hypothetical protein IKD25_05990 [Bacteroidaceae bacterium]|nr:hypothetical protein [Bacteroidaceae bacterium]
MFRAIQYIGNQELLKKEKTLFVCSKRAPMATYEKIFGWVESQTKKDVVMCCNTTELEQEVLKSLLVNEVPTILVVMNRFRGENNVQIQRALADFLMASEKSLYGQKSIYCLTPTGEILHIYKEKGLMGISYGAFFIEKSQAQVWLKQLEEWKKKQGIQQ